MKKKSNKNLYVKADFAVTVAYTKKYGNKVHLGLSNTPLNSSQVNFSSRKRQETSENLWCSEIFQGIKKINIDLKWIKLGRNIYER